jgi:putative phosphonate metabolism protein
MKRYAIYYAPPSGPLADFTARWLGRDPVQGKPVDHPTIAGLPGTVSALTEAPRKYGFHGTLKAPFRLNDSSNADALLAACQDLANHVAPLSIGEMRVARIGGFVAVVPQQNSPALQDFAMTIVRELDGFRAPLTAADIARRNPDRLNDRQRAHLMTWGYPHLMEDFHFHLTLTGDLPASEADAVVTVLEPIIMPMIETPFIIRDICLFGEDDAGRFHLLKRYPLAG